MPFTFNGNTPAAITFNGDEVRTLIYNGVTVWEKAIASVVTLYSDEVYYRGVGTGDYETLRLGKQGSSGGYSQFRFEPHHAFDTFASAKICLYVKSAPSDLYIIAQSRNASDSSTSAGWNDDITVSGVEVGWLEIDVTQILQNVVAAGSIVDIGCKFSIRSFSGNTTIGGNIGEYAAYLVLS